MKKFKVTVLTAIMLVTISTFTCMAANVTTVEKGIEYYRNYKYTQALSCFRKEADKGNATALFYLGLMCRHGDGVPQDNKKALELFRKAADKGETRAMNNIGGMYGVGQGVAQDKRQEIYWYKKSASKGDVIAMNNLGGMYEFGEGVTQDRQQAIYWYKKAVDSASSNIRSGDEIAIEHAQRALKRLRN